MFIKELVIPNIKMSLDSILKPVKWVDGKVQKQFTIIGKRIPDNHLYKVTMAAQMIGKVGTASWGPYLGISPFVTGYASGIFLDGPDFYYNLAGLQGRIKKDSDGETITIDPMQNFSERYNGAIRLPVFLTGVGFLGKSIYDIANYVMTGEPLTSETAMNATTGFGFLSLASSMYLKDQDPKSLEKNPSRVKAFFKDLYEKAKGLVPSPNPAPQPVLVQAYSTLDNYVQAQPLK